MVPLLNVNLHITGTVFQFRQKGWKLFHFQGNNHNYLSQEVIRLSIKKSPAAVAEHFYYRGDQKLFQILMFSIFSVFI